MEKIELFPTFLTRFVYQHNINFKEIFNNNLHKYSNNINGITYSGERQGFNLLHHEPEFNDFYDWVIQCTFDYLNELSIDMGKFHLILAKSWPSLVTNDVKVPYHNHADHHLSFIYYVNTPYGCDHINFGDPRYPNNLNEPFPGAFNYELELKPNIKTYNKYNSKSFYFPVSDGQLYIFPSKMNHWTSTASEIPYEGTRQALAGDFLLIYNDIKNHSPFGLYKQDYWKFYS